MNIFEKIFGKLNKASIKYLVVGGVAVNLYGYSRFTGDLDILLLLEEKNLMKFDKVMKKLDYSERLPVSIMELRDNQKVKKWLKEKNSKAFTFNPPGQGLLQIDIIIEDSLKFGRFDKKKIIKKIKNIKIPLISIDDLIGMKRRIKRDIDILDIKELLAIKNL